MAQMKLKFDKLDVGCGHRKPDGYIGVDIGYFKYPFKEFVQADINYPLPFDDGSFMEIRAWQTLEHLDNSRKVEFLNEINRLLKTGGIFKAEFPTPICNDGSPNPGFYTDPTHTAWWMPGTFPCFDKAWRESNENRQIYEGGYHINTNFKIVNLGWSDNNNCLIEMVKL